MQKNVMRKTELPKNIILIINLEYVENYNLIHKITSQSNQIQIQLDTIT